MGKKTFPIEKVNPKYRDQCWDCGKDKYKDVRDMGAIGIAMRKCPVCKKVKGVIPARDWAYRAGDLEKYI